MLYETLHGQKEDIPEMYHGFSYNVWLWMFIADRGKVIWDTGYFPWGIVKHPTKAFNWDIEEMGYVAKLPAMQLGEM